ncbi:FAD-dependent monooxygenase [uncultured Bradyrhizobium sp.]|uniref:FAD binding domain-containing protein n=1 Tax=Bradyrhizobium sp. TaxID=376 RepID=UPI00261F5AE8|nr:FAD-dependent monooxygenase [uncultured Bradyrhizobium sp.]
MRIAIIGGSLAGLFAATLLTQDGHDVIVYERSLHGLEGRGAGLLGKRETFAVLRAAGCEHVARVGVVARERIVFGDTGPTIDQKMPPQMQISWDYIYRVFRQRMANGSYLLDRKVEQLREEADRVVVRFSDGSETAADLVIGADGIASVARATVDSQAAANVYAGYVGWRGLLPERDLPGFAASDLLERFAYFRMPHSHVLGFLVPGPNGETKPGDRRYNWVWYRPAIGPTARDDVLTDREGRIHPYSLPPGAISERARERLVDDAKRLLPRSFVAAVEATRQPFVQGIFDYETERMISQRIALVGDAAFVVRPHTGMGIAKAAADAMALRKHLASAPLGEALQQYGRERRQAGGAIAASGRELGAHLV